MAVDRASSSLAPSLRRASSSVPANVCRLACKPARVVCRCEMARRKLAIARRTEGVEYAHNLGLLQHRWGDAQRAYPIEPFVVPAYEPGFFPAPGVAPAYDPLPGGNIAFPGPDAALFDGLHLTDEAMRVLVDHVLDQGLAAALRGEGWPR